jgi:hypothetical protein
MLATQPLLDVLPAALLLPAAAAAAAVGVLLLLRRVLAPRVSFVLWSQLAMIGYLLSG